MPDDAFFNRVINRLRRGGSDGAAPAGSGTLLSRLGAGAHAPRSGPMAVGIFGKHRRSPEHLFDLGGSAELAELKDVLYDHGIRYAVDQNVWKDLAGEDFLPFNHVLVAWRDGATLVARVAATRDDLRRTDFPMIVAAVQPGVPPAATPRIFEVVRATFHDAARATSLQHLHDIIAEHRARALTAPPDLQDFPFDATAMGELADRLALGPDAAGLVKVLYQLDRQMSSWTAPARASRIGLRGAAHMRVPGVADWPVESAALWAQFFHERTAEQHAPVMAFADAAGRFVDVIVGDPAPPLLRCLHTAPRAM